MDIQEEIKLRKEQLEAQKKLEQQRINTATLNAEKYIPQIVSEVRNAAVRRAAVASTHKEIYHRGLFGGTKYIKIDYKFSQDDSGVKLEWYLAFYRANRDVLCKKLAAAINAAGLCNTYVSFYEPRYYFYITTELNIT